MAQSHHWDVEHVRDGVSLELRDGEREHMRLTRDGETVELRVDDGVGKVFGGDEVPTWVQNVAARLGVFEVR